ncbi:DsbA family oxidoreductase [Roseobacteraceae bacterium NS-SX3]
MKQTGEQQRIRVDIVSDVVCPWCVVGYRQLAAAAKQTATLLDVYWHPFELNPEMLPEGENLRDHIMRKYGSSPEASSQVRQQLTDLGESLGFAFRFSDGMRIYNTFQAHQLISWAGTLGKGEEMKLALFDAYFTEGKNVSDIGVLVQTAEGIGLDGAGARRVLESGEFAEQTRAHEAFWLRQGISGVPAMVFQERHLVTGAQGVSTYANILTQLPLAGAEDEGAE